MPAATFDGISGSMNFKASASASRLTSAPMGQPWIAEKPSLGGSCERALPSLFRHQRHPSHPTAFLPNTPLREDNSLQPSVIGHLQAPPVLIFPGPTVHLSSLRLTSRAQPTPLLSIDSPARLTSPPIHCKPTSKAHFWHNCQPASRSAVRQCRIGQHRIGSGIRGHA